MTFDASPILGLAELFEKPLKKITLPKESEKKVYLYCEIFRRKHEKDKQRKTKMKLNVEKQNKTNKNQEPNKTKKRRKKKKKESTTDTSPLKNNKDDDNETESVIDDDPSLILPERNTCNTHKWPKKLSVPKIEPVMKKTAVDCTILPASNETSQIISPSSFDLVGSLLGDAKPCVSINHPTAATDSCVFTKPATLPDSPEHKVDSGINTSTKISINSTISKEVKIKVIAKKSPIRKTSKGLLHAMKSLKQRTSNDAARKSYTCRKDMMEDLSPEEVSNSAQESISSENSVLPNICKTSEIVSGKECSAEKKLSNYIDPSVEFTDSNRITSSGNQRNEHIQVKLKENCTVTDKDNKLDIHPLPIIKTSNDNISNNKNTNDNNVPNVGSSFDNYTAEKRKMNAEPHQDSPTKRKKSDEISESHRRRTSRKSFSEDSASIPVDIKPSRVTSDGSSVCESKGEDTFGTKNKEALIENQSNQSGWEKVAEGSTSHVEGRGRDLPAQRRRNIPKANAWNSHEERHPGTPNQWFDSSQERKYRNAPNENERNMTDNDGRYRNKHNYDNHSNRFRNTNRNDCNEYNRNHLNEEHSRRNTRSMSRRYGQQNYEGSSPWSQGPKLLDLVAGTPMGTEVIKSASETRKRGTNRNKNKGPKKREASRKYWDKRELEMQREREKREYDAQQPCVYYKTHGKCKYGDQCRFNHNIEVDVKLECCKYYVAGACIKGDDCTFIHGDWPCKFFHRLGFCNSDNCRFSHDEMSPKMREVFEARMQYEDSLNAENKQNAPPEYTHMQSSNEINPAPAPVPTVNEQVDNAEKPKEENVQAPKKIEEFQFPSLYYELT